MKKIATLGLLFAPAFTFAAASAFTVIQTIQNIFNFLIPLLITIAVVYFFWGLIQYVSAGGNEEKATEARNTMVYGIIALFVMVSVWGLIGLVGNTFGIAPGGSGQNLIPQVIN